MIYRKLLEMYSRVNRNHKRQFLFKLLTLTLVTGLISWTSTTAVNTASMLTISEVRAEESQVAIKPISVTLPVDRVSDDSQIAENPAQEIGQPVTVTHQTPVVQTGYYQETVSAMQPQAATAYPTVLANGNTAGAIGSEAAAQMAARTGVPQATWEYIIARESNGNPNAANASGASGLFQTMPGWGSTATVEDQIDAAVNAYNNQGLAAWGM